MSVYVMVGHSLHRPITKLIFFILWLFCASFIFMHSSSFGFNLFSCDFLFIVWHSIILLPRFNSYFLFFFCFFFRLATVVCKLEDNIDLSANETIIEWRIDSLRGFLLVNRYEKLSHEPIIANYEENPDLIIVSLWIHSILYEWCSKFWIIFINAILD